MEKKRFLFVSLAGLVGDIAWQVAKEGHDVRYFIGTESEFSASGELTVVASPYGTHEQVLGAVGVIGPMRMDYQRVIPLVNFTAQVLSRVLEQA